MTRRVTPAVSVVALVLVLAACTGTGTSHQAKSLANVNVPDSISVTSSAFTNGGAIPRAYTCDGAGSIPALAWSAPPAGTKSVAVVVDDPDATGGDYVHWVVIQLDPSRRTLPGPTPAAHQLDNTGGTRGWTPPCPPPGRDHHYRFSVYALRDYVCASNGDAVPSADCSEPSAEDALGQIADNAIAKGTLVGTYRR